MSAGTLLYVAVFEVFGRERGKSGVNGLIQLVAIILGFSVMMTIDLLGTSQKYCCVRQYETYRNELYFQLHMTTTTKKRYNGTKGKAT